MTLAEILPHVGTSLPASLSALAEHAAREGWDRDPVRCRRRWGRGGGREYHVTLLPAEVQARIGLASGHDAPGGEAPEGRSMALWTAFERLSAGGKAKARERLVAVQAVERMSGVTRQQAVAHVAAHHGVSASSLWSWLERVAEVPRADRLAALAPRHAGRTATAACDPRAWDYLKADYLRPEQPSFEACHRRMLEAAAEHGWTPLPSAKTLLRRIEREIPARVQTLARQGREAAARTLPAQRRDRSCFRALQAVNADGHKLDLHVRWDDGTIGRPILAVWQDLMSGTVLSCRVDRTENREVVQLAFADLVHRWGIPEDAYLDNGRAWAAKWITGRMAFRHRFRVRDEEPEGILTALGVRVHWTTPYHGQAKPIERAFRDWCEDIAKHPAFAGAYTGPNPVNKPSNYASKAIPIGDLRALLPSLVDAHNRREGRRSLTAKGRSLQATLEESLAAGAMVRRATEAQRRMLLLAAEGVTARKPTGELHLMGSRYWAEELLDHMGERLVVRFDPQDLGQPLAVYTLDNRLITVAEPLGDVMFDDASGFRDWARANRDRLRATRDLLDAERRLDVHAAARLLPRGAPPSVDPPPARVVRMVANGRPTREHLAQADEDFGRGVRLLEEGAVLPFARKEEGGP